MTCTDYKHDWKNHKCKVCGLSDSTKRIAFLEEQVKTLTRLMKNDYVDWVNAGGPNQCKHGFAAGIACRDCDLATVND